MLDYTLFFIGSFLTIASIFISFKKIINEKPNYSIKNILILIGGSAIATVLYYLDQPIIKNIFTLVFFVSIFKLNSQKTNKELTYYAIIIWIYGMTIDFINMAIVSLTGISKIIDMMYVRTCAGVVIAVMLILFCSLSKVKNFTNKTIEKILKIRHSIIIDIILILLLIILAFICLIYINKISITLFIDFTALLLIFFIYLILSKNYGIRRLKELNDILIKNNEFYIKLDSDYRILKHNLTHQLQGIKLVANEKAKNLIDDLIINYNSKFVVSKDINKIPKGISGIVYEKFYSLNMNDIKLVVDNSIKEELIEVLKPRTFNQLCETIGILVDNALEATNISDDKTILIDFSETNNSINITISNTFNSNLDVDKIGEKDYTTKGNNHGIGLFSIFRRNDIKIKPKIINNLFITELKVIKNNK